MRVLVRGSIGSFNDTGSVAGGKHRQLVSWMHNNLVTGRSTGNAEENHDTLTELPVEVARVQIYTA
jgi:hypothetical protein